MTLFFPESVHNNYMGIYTCQKDETGDVIGILFIKKCV